MSLENKDISQVRFNDNNDQPRETLFQRAKNLATRVSPFKDSTNQRYSSNESEQDDEMQRDIMREILEADQAAAREDREREAEERRQAWRDWWQGVKTSLPLRSSQTRPSQTRVANEYLLDEQSDADWMQWLTPLTYFRLATTALYTALDQLRAVMQILIQSDWAKPFRIAMLGLLGLGLGFLVMTTVSTNYGRLSMPQALSSSSAYWESAGAAMHRMNRFIPSIHWAAREKDLADLWETDDDGRYQMEDVLRVYEKELKMLRKTGELHNASIQKLEGIIPKVVHMQLKDGKAAVSDDFWHALRDLIRSDEDITTFDQDHGYYGMSSDKQWRAVVARLVKDSTFSSSLDQNLEGVEGRIHDKLADTWETWIRNNNGIISELLGTELEKIQAAGSGQNFEKRLNEIVKTRLRDDQSKGLVVTREEFLRHLQTEFAAHRSEVKAELKDLRPHLDKMIRDSIRLALDNAPRSLSQSEITTMVTTLVRRSLADINLGSIASGQIHVHWDSELKHQVNYFSIASGAAIDAKYTSSTWNPQHRRFASDKNYYKLVHSLRDKLGPFPPSRALQPWFDDGDCWCAARSYNHRGNPHGAVLSVLLGHRIVPTHLVLEHILPGATVDPTSRPRHMEVYARIEDPTVRSHVEDFAAVYFPDSRDDWNFHPPEEFDPSFVKIGEFTYDEKEVRLDDGVYVYRLNDELAGLGAATDQVVVRAVSNYGAKEYTCFYRVRLYGEKED